MGKDINIRIFILISKKLFERENLILLLLILFFDNVKL